MLHNDICICYIFQSKKYPYVGKKLNFMVKLDILCEHNFFHHLVTLHCRKSIYHVPTKYLTPPFKTFHLLATIFLSLGSRRSIITKMHLSAEDQSNNLESSTPTYLLTFELMITVWADVFLCSPHLTSDELVYSPHNVVQSLDLNLLNIMGFINSFYLPPSFWIPCTNVVVLESNFGWRWCKLDFWY